jgi:hypothetical protein
MRKPGCFRLREQRTRIVPLDQSRVSEIADGPFLVQSLYSRIDRLPRPINCYGNLVGGLAGFEHVTKLDFLFGRPRSYSSDRRGHHLAKA